MMGHVSEPYPEGETYQQHAEMTGPSFWLGPFEAAGFDPFPSREQRRAFLARRDVHGNDLRRQQSNNAVGFLGGVTSFHGSVNYKLAEMIVFEGWKSAMARWFQVAAPAVIEAYCRVGAWWHAIGKNERAAIPLWMVDAHPGTYFGKPGFHFHRTKTGMALDMEAHLLAGGRVADERKAWGSDRRAIMDFITENLFDRVVNESLVRRSPLLGWDLELNDKGKAVDRSVDPPMMRALGIGEAREKILEITAKAKVPANYGAQIIANKIHRGSGPAPRFTPTQLTDQWGAALEKGVKEGLIPERREYARLPKPVGRDLQGWIAVQSNILREVENEVRIAWGDPRARTSERHQSNQRTLIEGYRELVDELQARDHEKSMRIDRLSRMSQPQQPPEISARRPIGPIEPVRPVPPVPPPVPPQDPKGQSAKPAAEPPLVIHPDNTKGPAGDQQWTLGGDGTWKDTSRPNWREISADDPPTRPLPRIEVKAPDDAFFLSIARGVMAAFDVYRIVVMKGWGKHVGEISIKTEADLDKLLMECSKTPLWRCHQETGKALVEGKFHGRGQALKAASQFFKEVRQPNIKLSKFSSIKVDESLVKELLEKGSQKLGKLQRLQKKSGCKLDAPGLTSADVSRLQERARKVREREHDRGQGH